MSTSDKLTYLNTTKSKIKQAINLAGASLTNEPFRQYSSKLYDSYLDILKNGTESLYASMPKVTGTGTELSLQNTAECPMVLELSASESTQKTTTGKNLFDFDGINVVGVTGDTATITKENGIVHVTGFTTTGIKSINFAFRNINLTSGTYFLSMDIKSSAGSFFKINDGTNQWTRVQAPNLSQDYQRYVYTYTYSSDYDLKKMLVQVLAENTTDSFYITNIMLSTSEDYAFEKYTNGASPNPDYPQQVNVVTGENSVKVSTGDKNLANLPVSSSYLNGLTPTITNGSIIHAEGTASASYSNITSSQIVDTTEILTLSITDFPTAGNLQVVYKETEDGEYKNKTLSTNDSTITFENGLYSYRIALVYLTANTAYNLTFKVQLEKGSTATSYAVHKEQNLTLSLGSLEFAGIGDYKDKIFNNIPSNPLYDSTLVEGGWYKYKRIGKHILTEVSNAVQGYSSGDTSDKGIFSYQETDKFTINNMLSTHFINQNISISSNNDAYSDLLDGCFAIRTGTTDRIYFRNSNITSKDVMNIWLTNHEVIIYYPLATPTNEQITDTTLVLQLEAIKNAVSYDDETNISQTNANRPFIISASAVKNSME